MKKNEQRLLVMMRPLSEGSLSSTEWVNGGASWSVDTSNNLNCYNASASTVATFNGDSWLGVKSYGPDDAT